MGDCYSPYKRVKMVAPKISRREFIKLARDMFLLSVPGLGYLAKNLPPDLPDKFPNVLLLVFDALSARDMSLFGYPRQTTPNLEAFANKATVYHRHHAAGSFTTSGVASILTSVYPWMHRALHIHGTPMLEFSNQNIFSALQARYHTFAFTHNPLVEILLNCFNNHIDQLERASEHGIFFDSWMEKLPNEDFAAAYEAEMALFRNNHVFPSGSLFLSTVDGLRRKLVENNLLKANQVEYPYGLPVILGRDLVGFIYFKLEDTFDWLIQQMKSTSQPYFGYVHVMPPHDPFRPRREFVGQFKDGWEPVTKPKHWSAGAASDEETNNLRRQYDEFILYTDAEFGRFISRLEQNGALDNTILVVTSDHGEMFERGLHYHQMPTLYEPHVHIPLLIHMPGQQQRQDIYTNTSAVDLLPTLCKLSGMELPSWSEGQVLPGMGFSQEASADRSTFCMDAKENPKTQPLRKASFAIYRQSYKLTLMQGYPQAADSWEMYDLENDPEEMNNLYSPSNAVASELKAELQARIEQSDQPYQKE